MEDIKNEIFDMVKPADPLRITYKDLLRSGRGDVVMSILTDVKGFVAYENRENLSESDEYQGGEEGWE